MIYGYARCSTNESKQDINRQLRELKAEGAQEVYFEYEHGDSATKEKQLALFDIAKEGDTVITLEVPRLARSTKQLCEIIEIVKQKKLKLVIVGSVTVDCTQGRLDPMSNAFIQMSGVFAELELGMIRERVKSGMANAKAKGIKLGRPPLSKDDIPQVFYRHYPAYKNGMLNVSEFARVCSMSRTTIYKYIDLLK
jgi:DNA invertase Pin-like site-specific DNA recombinase